MPGGPRGRPGRGDEQRAVSRAATPKKHERSGKPGPPPSPTSLHGARTRKEIALAELREIEVRTKRGELLDAEAVAREWASVLRLVRAGMMSVVSRVRARLPHVGAADAQVLDEEIRAALTALADDPTPGRGDRKRVGG